MDFMLLYILAHDGKISENPLTYASFILYDTKWTWIASAI